MRLCTPNRVIALAMVALFGAAQLGAAAHEEREHAVCPEHGELVHVGDHEAPIAALPGVAALPSEELHADHCVAQFSLQTVRHTAPVLVEIGAATIGPLHIAPAYVFAPIAVLHLAPKSSPPVA